MKILHVVILLWTLCPFPFVHGQGMVPVSPSRDHHEERGDGKHLSKDKIEAHMKIATQHLEQREEEGLKDDRISRKDKPLSLQNPSKHAAEEFVLQFLLQQYPKSTKAEEQVEILQNLENFSHKFENGRDLFKATNALQEILLPALNSSHEDVRRSACGVFAIASQNNRDVQDVAVDAGVIRPLIHLISFDQGARSKALFALSALVRNYPKAQAKFVKDGGVPALVKVASFSETRRRALTFITDLLQERNYCRKHGDNQSPEDLDDPCDELKVLEKSLEESGWCDILADSVKNIPGFDVDDQTLTAEAVWSSLPFCGKTVRPYGMIFNRLLHKLEVDEDFKTEAQLVRNIIEALNISDKDEL